MSDYSSLGFVDSKVTISLYPAVLANKQTFLIGTNYIQNHGFPCYFLKFVNNEIVGKASQEFIR